MKICQRNMVSRHAVALWLALAGCAVAGGASAHSVGWSQSSLTTTVFTFYYVGGEPMAAEVKLFAPGAARAPYLTTRTDPQGRVAFIADRPGTWRAEAVDGHGHSIAGTATVNQAGNVRDPTTGIAAVLWLSLAANLIFAIMLWRRRTKAVWPSATDDS